MTRIRIWLARIRRHRDYRRRMFYLTEYQCGLMSYGILASEKRIPEELIIHG